MLARISDDRQTIAEPDYSNRYALNVCLPPLASASSQFELAPDGTLAKGQAALDTTKLLDAASAVTVARISAKETKATPAEVAATITMSVAQRGYMYALTRREDVVQGKASTFAGPIPFNLVKTPYTRTVMGANPESTDDSGIHFSGSIALPKKQSP